MSRPRKDYVLLNMKLDANVGDLLEAFCSVTGQTKTSAVERAVSQYITDYCDRHLLTTELNAAKENLISYK